MFDFTAFAVKQLLYMWYKYSFVIANAFLRMASLRIVSICYTSSQINKFASFHKIPFFHEDTKEDKGPFISLSASGSMIKYERLKRFMIIVCNKIFICANTL